MRKTVFLPFEDARKFALSLKLKKGENWRDLFKSKKLPSGLPYRPERTYKNNWQGWGDFLGTGNVHPKDKKFMDYFSAKKFVKQMKIKSSSKYREFCKTSKKPKSLPTNPDKIYKNNWQGWGDFLGTGTISVNILTTNWLYYEEAKKIVRSLKLISQTEWRKYCKSVKKPQNIPSAPNKVYKNKGWKGMGDWLGTNRIPNQLRTYKSFLDARTFAHSLKLKGKNDWSKTVKEFPTYIPRHPERIYKKEWHSWGDWLETGSISVKIKASNWKSFGEARQIVQELAKKHNIKNYQDWINAKNSGLIPSDIPKYPWEIYSRKRKYK